MAKSIYEILNDLVTETSVPKITDSEGKTLRENLGEIVHTIPRDLLPTAEQFEDESALVDWANDNDCIHAVMQKGIQKFLIEIRAAFKGCKKADTWSEEYGQNNVDAMEWSITKRPNQNTDKAKLLQAKLEAGIEMAQAMKSAGLDNDLILASLTPVYGDDGAKAIMEAIE